MKRREQCTKERQVIENQIKQKEKELDKEKEKFQMDVSTMKVGRN